MCQQPFISSSIIIPFERFEYSSVQRLQLIGASMWGKRLKRTMPLSLAKFSEATEIWFTWLSKIINTIFSFEHLTYWIKCFKKTSKFVPVIQPDGCADPAQPGGPPFKKQSFIFNTLG